MRVRIPPGPQQSLVGRETDEEFWTASSSKSNLDFRFVASDNRIELDGLMCYPEWKTRSGFAFQFLVSTPRDRPVPPAASNTAKCTHKIVRHVPEGTLLKTEDASGKFFILHV
jgi:hypothetical protein